MELQKEPLYVPASDLCMFDELGIDMELYENATNELLPGKTLSTSLVELFGFLPF